jgi:hypothetical protein
VFCHASIGITISDTTASGPRTLSSARSVDEVYGRSDAHVGAHGEKRPAQLEAGNDNALTFRAKQARGRCYPEGTVYSDGPDDKGLVAASLGEPPFTYTVRLMLDGNHYLARARWPADEIRGNEPSVALEFSPDLPALN